MLLGIVTPDCGLTQAQQYCSIVLTTKNNVAPTTLLHPVFNNLVQLIIFAVYTVKNATDLLEIFNFTGLLQFVNKLPQACQFHHVATSLLKSGLLQIVICRLVIYNLPITKSYLL